MQKYNNGPDNIIKTIISVYPNLAKYREKIQTDVMKSINKYIKKEDEKKKQKRYYASKIPTKCMVFDKVVINDCVYYKDEFGNLSDKNATMVGYVRHNASGNINYLFDNSVFGVEIKPVTYEVEIPVLD